MLNDAFLEVLRYFNISDAKLYKISHFILVTIIILSIWNVVLAEPTVIRLMHKQNVNSIKTPAQAIFRWVMSLTLVTVTYWVVPVIREWVMMHIKWPGSCTDYLCNT